LSDANAEVAAYQLDELFRLNVVPITVLRGIKGIGSGSAQYYVKNASFLADDLNTPGYRRIKILDYIINNSDRHDQNGLYLALSNRAVAIDNGRSFRPEETPPHAPEPLETILTYLQSEPDLSTTLQTVSDRDVRKVLEPYLRMIYIQGVLDRIHAIQKHLTP
jgi:hypothetical protein